MVRGERAPLLLLLAFAAARRVSRRLASSPLARRAARLELCTSHTFAREQKRSSLRPERGEVDLLSSRTARADRSLSHTAAASHAKATGSQKPRTTYTQQAQAQARAAVPRAPAQSVFCFFFLGLAASLAASSASLASSSPESLVALPPSDDDAWKSSSTASGRAGVRGRRQLWLSVAVDEQAEEEREERTHPPTRRPHPWRPRPPSSPACPRRRSSRRRRCRSP